MSVLQAVSILLEIGRLILCFRTGPVKFYELPDRLTGPQHNQKEEEGFLTEVFPLGLTPLCALKYVCSGGKGYLLCAAV